MSEWISVEDRLPEKQSWNHIAILDTKTSRISVEQDLYAIETAENFKHKKGFCKDGRFNGREVVIAWMPFPEPPISKQVTSSKRRPATETCLFCGRKIPDRSNADTIREFVCRFRQTASESTTTLLGTSIVTYRISPEELEELMDNMIAEVIGEDSMKAWITKETVNFGATVVFAKTRNKAKSLALCTSCCEGANFCDIEVRRVPQMDKYYVDGKSEMDWFNPKDRIALVKECGFYCRHPIAEDCKDCPAKEFCDESVLKKEHPNDR